MFYLVHCAISAVRTGIGVIHLSRKQVGFIGREQVTFVCTHERYIIESTYHFGRRHSPWPSHADLNLTADGLTRLQIQKSTHQNHTVMVCQCKCIERHMQSKRSVLEDDETRGLSACNCNKVICSVLLVSNQICMNAR